MSLITPSVVQRILSPKADAVFSAFYYRRKSILWGIKILAEKLDQREKLALKMCLVNNGIIQGNFQHLSLSEIESYHLSKAVTFKTLRFAADEFFNQTGIADFSLKICPRIDDGIMAGEVELGNQKDFRQVLISVVEPKVEMTEEDLQGGAIYAAYQFAQFLEFGSKKALFYRIQKVADMGGDTRAIVSSLFMDAKPSFLTSIWSAGSQLERYRKTIIADVSRLQALRQNFKFDINGFFVGTKAERDNYIFHKIVELVGAAQTHQVFLLFLIDKLIAARAAVDATDPIFNEIRLLYAPLARRLGMNHLVDDFRDQYLRLKFPLTYQSVVKEFEKRFDMDYEGAKKYFDIYARWLYTYLQKKFGIDFQHGMVKFRIKSPYSIWNKVYVRREYPFDQLKDVFGLKAVCPSLKLMLAARDRLTGKNPLFTADPALTITSIGDRTKWQGIKLVGLNTDNILVEIQIMTQEMFNDNNTGQVSTAIYEMKKDLIIRDPNGNEIVIDQDYDRLAQGPSEISPNFAENFHNLRDWTATGQIVIPR